MSEKTDKAETATPTPKKKASVSFTHIGLGIVFILALIGIGLGVMANYTHFQHHQLPWQKAKHAQPKDNTPLLIANNEGKIHQLQTQLDQINAMLMRQSQAASKSATGKTVVVKEPTTHVGRLYLELAKVELMNFGNLSAGRQLIAQAQMAFVSEGNSKLAAELQQSLSHIRASKRSGNNQATQALAKLRQQLPKLQFSLPVPKPEHAANVDSKDPKWKQALNESWRRIRSLLIIRDNQNVTSMQITDAARASTLSVMMYKLQLAESYYKDGNWVLYDSTLNSLKNNAKSAFQYNQQLTDFINTLNVAASGSHRQDIDWLVKSVNQALAGLKG